MCYPLLPMSYVYDEPVSPKNIQKFRKLGNLPRHQDPIGGLHPASTTFYGVLDPHKSVSKRPKSAIVN